MEKLPKKAKIEAFKFDKATTREEVIEEMKKRGFKPVPAEYLEDLEKVKIETKEKK